MSSSEKNHTPSASFSLTRTVSADGTITGTFTFRPKGDMMEIEESVLDLTNTIGREVLEPSLASFDADGRPVQVGATKYYSRGLFNQTYQTSFGPVALQRHVYQSAKGGRTFVPLEVKAALILNSSPLLAKMVSFKLGNMPSTAVETDFAENHRRPISRDYIKSLSDEVGVLAQEIEQIHEYIDPLDINKDNVSTISISLDCTTVLFTEDGKSVSYRETMVGVISIIDDMGERLHTIYVGEAPEYGKEKFLERLDRELNRAKARYPNAKIQGIADGAASNWAFLDSRTDTQLLDFYHLS
ncbi:MAG: ISKra4 family transposase, partial [Deltaproteobacteria bacterium]|nr:ISKra4 family transposase [Deltaproteobacteria bacterium]